MSYSWHVGIDTTGKSTFVYDAAPDLTSVRIDRGRSGRLGICNVGTCTIEVDGDDQKYMLDHAQAVPGLARGRRLRLQIIVDGHRIDLFHGRIRSIRPKLKQSDGTRQATISCEDAMMQLGERDIETGLLRRKTYDRLIAAILAEARWSGRTSVHAVPTWGIAWAWFEDGSALSAIEEVLEADGLGTFFISRGGAATFHAGKFRPVLRRLDAYDVSEYVVDFEELDDDVVTEVRAVANPREAAKLQEIWSYPGEVTLKAGKSHTRWAEFADPILLTAAVTKAAGDLAAVKAGTKIDRSSSIAVTLNIVGATRAKVTVKNTHATDTVRVTKVRVRGRPVRALRPVVSLMRSQDLQVIGAHRVGSTKVGAGTAKIKKGFEGEHHYRRHGIDSPWVQTAGNAEGLARTMLTRLSSPQPRIALTLESSQEAVIRRFAQFEISNRIRFSHAALGLANADYWIDHITHEVRPPNLWRSRIVLTPAFVIDADRRVGAGAKVGTSKAG